MYDIFKTVFILIPELIPLEKFMSSSTTSGCSSLSLAGMELGLAMVMMPSNMGSSSILTVVRMLRLSSTINIVPCFFIMVQSYEISSKSGHYCLIIRRKNADSGIKSYFFCSFWYPIGIYLF